MTGISALPSAPAAFVGRDAELAIATSALLQPKYRYRAIALTGLPGIGKSATAAALAHRLLEHFPDGAVWIACNAVTSGRRGMQEIAVDLARALSVKELAFPTSSSVRRVRDLLRHRRILVVLDDVEDTGQFLDLLPEADCPTAMVLTSRGELSSEIPAVALGALDDQAIVKFLRTASQGTTDLDPALREELVRSTQGSPLALAVLARMLVDGERLPAKVLRSLRNELVYSSFVEDPVLPPSVRGTLAIAYRDLDPSSAALLRAIALMPHGHFTVAELAGETHAAPGVLHALLDRLVERGFLQHEGETYSAHPLVQRFAAGRLSDEEAHEGTTLLAYKHLRAPDLETVRHDVYRGLTDWQRAPSNRIDAQEYALRLAQEQGDPHDVARALANLGTLHLDAGEPDDAEAALRAAVATARRVGDDALEAQSTLTLAHVARRRDEASLAGTLYVESARLFNRIGDHRGCARALASHGDLLVADEDLDAARELFAQAAREAPAEDHELNALLISRRAQLAALAGEHEDARALCRGALQEAQGDRERGQLWLLLGTMQAQTGDAEEAAASLTNARDHALRAGYWLLAARALVALGAVAVERDDRARARACFEGAKRVLEEDAAQPAAIAAFGLGVVAAADGAAQHAIVQFEQALSLFRETHDAAGEAHAVGALVALLRGAGDVAGAEAAAAEARARLARLGEHALPAATALRLLALGSPGPPDALALNPPATL